MSDEFDVDSALIKQVVQTKADASIPANDLMKAKLLAAAAKEGVGEGEGEPGGGGGKGGGRMMETFWLTKLRAQEAEKREAAEGELKQKLEKHEDSLRTYKVLYGKVQRQLAQTKEEHAAQIEELRHELAEVHKHKTEADKWRRLHKEEEITPAKIPHF